MDIFLTLFFIVFATIFIAIFIMFFKAIYNSIAEKRYNDSQPVLTKNAKISAKRSEVTGGGKKRRVRTYYFATFEFSDSRERLELEIPSEEYGLMAEDDSGMLTFQGRRYHKFERI